MFENVDVHASFISTVSCISHRNSQTSFLVEAIEENCPLGPRKFDVSLFFIPCENPINVVQVLELKNYWFKKIHYATKEGSGVDHDREQRKHVS